MVFGSLGLWSLYATILNLLEHNSHHHSLKDLRPKTYGPLFESHLLPNVTIIVDIHEEVLAPFGPCLRVVTEHDALEFHTQRRLRSQQRHSGFIRRAVALAVVAGNACGYDVYRRVVAATRSRQDMI